MYQNKLSNLFLVKFLGSTFQNISKKSWIHTYFKYIIDSKYRTTKRLDLFLKEQLNKPHPDLVKVAEELRLKSKTPDQLIINVLKYVNNRVKYVSDQSNFNRIEKWAGAYNAWKSRRADCDDSNCLIYILARLAGISDLTLWSAIGTVTIGGHYWNLYFSTKKERWYTIDSTFYPDMNPIRSRTPFTFNSRKYNNIWYLFNEQAILKQR